MLRRIDAGAFALLADIGRALRQTVDDRSQAARRGEGLDLVEVEAGGFQLVAEQARQVLARAGLHPRRDFLGEQFKQKFSHVLADAVVEAEIVVGDREDQPIFLKAVRDET